MTNLKKKARTKPEITQFETPEDLLAFGSKGLSQVDLESLVELAEQMERSAARDPDRLQHYLRESQLGHLNSDATDEAALGQLAQEIVSSRRRRSAVFQSDDLFGEPAWDILLGLYVAGDAQLELSVTEVCDVAGLPPTTGLRWIERLEREAWVRRVPDPGDRRRFWVHLTERASNVMRKYLQSMRLRPNLG